MRGDLTAVAATVGVGASVPFLSVGILGAPIRALEWWQAVLLLVAMFPMAATFGASAYEATVEHTLQEPVDLGAGCGLAYFAYPAGVVLGDGALGLLQVGSVFFVGALAVSFAVAAAAGLSFPWVVGRRLLRHRVHGVDLASRLEKGESGDTGGGST